METPVFGYSGPHDNKPIMLVRASMPHEGTQGCIEELRNAVLHSPSILGRLISIAALYDKKTDRYRHELAARFGAEEVDRELRELHVQVFRYWLTLSLQLQKADVNVYLATINAGTEVLSELYALAESWIPPSAIDAECQLFLSDLGVVMPLIRYDL
jgi:hypothetical protein